MTSAYVLLVALSLPTHEAVPIRTARENGLTDIFEAMATGPHAAAIEATLPRDRRGYREGQSHITAMYLHRQVTTEERSGVVRLHVAAGSGLDRAVILAAFEAAYNGWFDRQVATLRHGVRALREKQAERADSIALNEQLGKTAAATLAAAADKDKPVLADRVRYHAGRVVEYREIWLREGRWLPAMELRLRRACRRPVVLVPADPAATVNANQ